MRARRSKNEERARGEGPPRGSAIAAACPGSSLVGEPARYRRESGLVVESDCEACSGGRIHLQWRASQASRASACRASGEGASTRSRASASGREPLGRIQSVSGAPCSRLERARERCSRSSTSTRASEPKLRAPDFARRVRAADGSALPAGRTSWRLERCTAARLASGAHEHGARASKDKPAAREKGATSTCRRASRTARGRHARARRSKMDARPNPSRRSQFGLSMMQRRRAWVCRSVRSPRAAALKLQRLAHGARPDDIDKLLPASSWRGRRGRALSFSSLPLEQVQTRCID